MPKSIRVTPCERRYALMAAPEPVGPPSMTAAQPLGAMMTSASPWPTSMYAILRSAANATAGRRRDDARIRRTALGKLRMCVTSVRRGKAGARSSREQASVNTFTAEKFTNFKRLRTLAHLRVYPQREGTWDGRDEDVPRFALSRGGRANARATQARGATPST